MIKIVASSYDWFNGEYIVKTGIVVSKVIVLVSVKFSLPDELDAITEYYVVCHVDYDTNKELVRKYRVNGGIPYSIVINKDGSIKTKLGYSGFSGYKAWLGLWC